MRAVLFSLMMLAGQLAWGISPDYIPHVDKVFLHAHERRDKLISGLASAIQPFCDSAYRLTEAEREKVSLAALESCHLLEVVDGIEASEHELGMKNGEPLMGRIFSRDFNESAAWRYFIRTQKVRRLMKSLRTYFSQSAGINAGTIGIVGIPKLAGSLDNFSYWTRLIAMIDNSECNQATKYCELVGAQLPSLAAEGLSRSRISSDDVGVNDHHDHIASMAKSMRQRLASLTLQELTQLENMEDVTSAGLGIPYFRQLIDRMNLENQNLSPLEQKKVQSTMILLDLQEALQRWKLPKDLVEVNAETIRLLTEELNTIILSLDGSGAGS